MSNELTIKEVEVLSYYDFMGYMGIPYFNVGGIASMDKLAELCKITKNTRVLEVGCGTGANACFLAKTYGCSVVGVDIAEHMVEYAQRRVEELGLTNLVSFKLGNAYRLEFTDEEFDVVLTVFVSQFLDPTRAFPEFFRVLKAGGYLGVNEMYKVDPIPADVMDRVDNGEKTFRELTELPFTLRSPATWRILFESLGFSDVTLEEHSFASEKPYALSSVESFGGWGSFIGTLWRMMVYMLRSSKMRERFIKIGKAKRVLVQDNVTSRYLGYILCIGRKSLISRIE
jgi:ubiquinone/menaquinone biosynthesis C-methylase UbiE